jgi:hypothetical protein
MIWVEGQFPHCSNRMYNGILFSDDGLRIQRFGNELFIAHPTFQFNWDVGNICYHEVRFDGLFYFKNSERPMIAIPNEAIIIFISGHVADYYPYQFRLTKEEYVLFRDFIIDIIK